MSRSSSASRLIAFYLGDGVNDSGRTFYEILGMSDEKLEDEHDYIQWLFPLDEPSEAVPSSPVLTKGAIEVLQADQATARMRDALRRMLAFYGLGPWSAADNLVSLERLPTYEGRSTHWLARCHNFKRITRILLSLRLMGLDAEAKAFHECLEAIYEEHSSSIGLKTIGYWRRAAGS